MRFWKLGVVTGALLVACPSLVQADSTIKTPGDHPHYRVEIEPHGLLGWDFYGFGFGLYGRLPRAELYLVVVAVWALMLLWSKPWLTHFRYGPLEWLWRSLARLRFQPMRGAALASD